MRKLRGLLNAEKAGRHLLLVDDEAPLLFLATRALEEHGYRVSGCGNGADALAAFKRNPLDFDLVVTDLKMRGMSGLDLLRELHAMRPELPVILASGHVDEELRATAIAAGAAAVLAKPGTIEELGDLVHRAACELVRG